MNQWDRPRMTCSQLVTGCFSKTLQHTWCSLQRNNSRMSDNLRDNLYSTLPHSLLSNHFLANIQHILGCLGCYQCIGCILAGIARTCQYWKRFQNYPRMRNNVQ
jgi:hypothetical protein